MYYYLCCYMSVCLPFFPSADRWRQPYRGSFNQWPHGSCCLVAADSGDWSKLCGKYHDNGLNLLPLHTTLLLLTLSCTITPPPTPSLFFSWWHYVCPLQGTWGYISLFGSPLAAASCFGHTDVVALLLKAEKIDVNKVNVSVMIWYLLTYHACSHLLYS